MSTDGRLIEDNVRVRRFEVDSNFDGWRLDKYLANRIEGLSRSKAGRIAKGDHVEVIPRRKIKAGTKLRDGDRVVLREYLAPERVQDHQVEILYEDEALLVINKPAGMLAQETATVRLNTVKYFLRRQGLEEAEPVHRLDRETSGVMICARTKEFAPPLCAQFAGQGPQKIYRALVVDTQARWQPGDRQRLDSGLGFEQDSALPHRVWSGDWEAITHVEAMGRRDHRMGELADLRIRIETGRQHQIRVHLAMENTPVAGDKLYSYDDQFFMDICDHPQHEELRSRLHFPRQSLDAQKIGIDHPLSGEPLKVEAPLPGLWDMPATDTDCDSGESR